MQTLSELDSTRATFPETGTLIRSGVGPTKKCADRLQTRDAGFTNLLLHRAESPLPFRALPGPSVAKAMFGSTHIRALPCRDNYAARFLIGATLPAPSDTHTSIESDHCCINCLRSLIH